MAKTSVNPKLTDTLRETLYAIRSFRTVRGYAPSMEDIAEVRNISRQAIGKHVQRLRAMGELAPTRGKKRSIRLAEGNR